MIIEGRVFRAFPENTNTDEIIAGKYKYDELDMEKLAVHTFESVDPNFYSEVKKFKDPILIAGKNFGCGSSREQAPLVLKACGIKCIIAESFGEIFYRNGFNIGLPLVRCRDILKGAKVGDSLRVDLLNGTISNLTTGGQIKCEPIPAFASEILREGGLLPYLRRRGGFG